MGRTPFEGVQARWTPKMRQLPGLQLRPLPEKTLGRAGQGRILVVVLGVRGLGGH